MIYGKKKLLAAMQKPKCRNTEEVNLECLYRVRKKKNSTYGYALSNTQMHNNNLYYVPIKIVV